MGRSKYTPGAKYTYNTGAEHANRDEATHQPPSTSANPIKDSDGGGATFADPPSKNYSSDLKFTAGGP